jgi:hypothetical protein
MCSSTPAGTTVGSFQGLFEQCCIGITGSFFGSFAPGDKVLVTYLAPLTINFNTPVQSVGAQIQFNTYGNFTAEILAFDGPTLLGVFTENGDATDLGNNSDIFLVSVRRLLDSFESLGFDGRFLDS